MNKYYTVYKTTNTINGKFYIGVHQTFDLNDDYLGSGILLKRALSAYGREHFVKEYIAIFDNAEDMFSLEGELVCESLVVDQSCYNLKTGGDGGWQSHNTDTAYKWARQKGALIRNASPVRDDTRRKMSDACKERWKNGELDHIRPGLAKSFLGKKHTEEGKNRIGEANRKMVGEKNSSFGTAWIFSLELKQSKKVQKHEVADYLSSGWQRGRKMKFKE